MGCSFNGSEWLEVNWPVHCLQQHVGLMQWRSPWWQTWRALSQSEKMMVFLGRRTKGCFMWGTQFRMFSHTHTHTDMENWAINYFCLLTWFNTFHETLNYRRVFKYVFVMLCTYWAEDRKRKENFVGLNVLIWEQFLWKCKFIVLDTFLYHQKSHLLHLQLHQRWWRTDARPELSLPRKPLVNISLIQRWSSVSFCTCASPW